MNPVAETSPAEQPAAHPETDVRLLDLNKIVNSTYNPRKNFREDTLLELAESIKQSGVLQPICVRPRDEGFEIVYGERRYWAAAMAGLKFIPALIRELSDAEAEDAAITENLQREDVRPREEAAAYKRALQSGRHTIESLVGKFGKSEAYIRSRLKLCELIDALAGMLDKEEISVGVATEIAKYPADIQQEVYNDHFAEGCYNSWKTARIKEIARRLYERYMTKLESYNFDKTECLSCQHNTANQVLFKDECTGGCAGCQNRECMIRKNNEFFGTEGRETPQGRSAYDTGHRRRNACRSARSTPEQGGLPRRRTGIQCRLLRQSSADARRSAGRKLRVRGGFCRGSGEA